MTHKRLQIRGGDGAVGQHALPLPNGCRKRDRERPKASDRTFTTGGPPTVTTEPATGVHSIEATLKGTVNPHGLATTYFFNYGTTDSLRAENHRKIRRLGNDATSPKRKW